ncbi:hypothetical protein AX15_004667 [Amanita polypyramis BW_CC]|nr:hypothetical protein AX15_004667 [Amanita polypyramis BW_CC]
MTLKRKFDFDLDDALSNHQKAKQLKLIPFPNMDSSDSDVAMSDAEPYYPELHHIRTDSSVSSTSSASLSPVIETPVCPPLDLYPHPFFSDEGSVDLDSDNFSYYSSQQAKIGLLQPSSSFKHHGTSCSQIPKLRVACAAGPGGQRTMWSFCEQCGAISMVNTD